jgi:hypothetical protein
LPDPRIGIPDLIPSISKEPNATKRESFTDSDQMRFSFWRHEIQSSNHETSTSLALARFRAVLSRSPFLVGCDRTGPRLSFFGFDHFHTFFSSKLDSKETQIQIRNPQSGHCLEFAAQQSLTFQWSPSINRKVRACRLTKTLCGSPAPYRSDIEDLLPHGSG